MISDGKRERMLAASDRASYLNSAVIPVDGGRIAVAGGVYRPEPTNLELAKESA